MDLSPLAPSDAGWSLTLYPGAGEAGGSFRYSLTKPHTPGGGGDPERSRNEAARRAAAKLRRYCAENRLNRLGTLTYAGTGCHDPKQVRRDVAQFFRTLRGLLGGDPMPYAWVPEWHRTNHGLHVHFALGRFVPRRLIVAAWPHGFVHIKLLGGLAAGSTSRDEARLAARYLAKYVRKSFDVRRVRGLHRYEVGQGFQPAAVLLRGRTFAAVLALASERMAGAPAEVWKSSEALGWEGPPAAWVVWS